MDTPINNNGGHVRPVPEDYETIRHWFGVIRHANSIIIHGSPQFVTMTVFIDAEGKPQLWGGIDTNALFPRNRSIKIVGE
jgi:hypothetical protein